MSVFSPAEIEYLQSERLGRLATISATGQPHVVPVRFKYNPEWDALDIGGRGMGASKKFRDAAHNLKAAFVIDDASPSGKPRGLEVRGRAEVHQTGGEKVMPDWDPQFVRLYPTHIAEWGIETDPFHPVGRDVVR